MEENQASLSQKADVSSKMAVCSKQELSERRIYLVEKVSLSLYEAAHKLKSISETALDNWSESLNSTINAELLEYFKQRIRSTLYRIDECLMAGHSYVDFAVEYESAAPQAMLLDREEYQLMRAELTRAFKEQTYFAGFDERNDQHEHQIAVLLGILEDAITYNLLTAASYACETLEAEKYRYKKTLTDVTEILERERQRLAFDLHDGPAQALSSALLQVDILEGFVSSAAAKEEIESLKSILGQCLHELRTSIYSLKPQSLAQKGLVAKIKGYVRQVTTRTGINITVVVEPEERVLPDVLEINIFRVVQEALSNVFKHAQASDVLVTIAFGKTEVACSIEDNGIGFDRSMIQSTNRDLSGYGLISMGERVEQFFGTFTISSEIGKGTRISFCIPF